MHYFSLKIINPQYNFHIVSMRDRISYVIQFPLNRRIVLGFKGGKNMPKLNFSGNLPNTIRNNILKLPVIPAGAFSNIQDSVQDGRQNVNTTI